MTSIKENEWLKELSRLAASSQGDEGFTTREWADKLGVSLKKALEMLNVAHAQGRLKRGFRNHERIDGKNMTVPVYSIIPAKKKGK